MDGFNISKIILGLQQNTALFLKKLYPQEQQPQNTFMQGLNNTAQSTQNANLNTLNNLGNTQTNTSLGQNQSGVNIQGANNTEIDRQALALNNMQNVDRSVFVKTLLGFPQDLGQLLLSLQNPNKPLTGGTLGIGNLNPALLQNKVLSNLFEETPISPNNLQDTAAVINMQAQGTAQVRQDAVALLFSGMISLPDISKLILDNGKHAVANLIIAMASTSKHGVSGEQIQETLKIINSCIAMAESNTPAQSLKSLMMLYLPWLPLNDGVGFDLEVTPQTGENDSNDSKLTVLIQTKNYGNIKGVFTLTTSNSVDVLIVCTENFPKKILQKSLMEESSSHAMNTTIDIEEISPKADEKNDTHETKVNLSATNEMNPYLLLMAHSFIRNTILIDNNA